MENQNNIPDSLLAKLKKLLALRDNAKDIGSDAESELAALRIQELLAKYNLDESILHQDDPPDKKNQIISKRFKISHLTKRHESTWVSDFINYIADINYCLTVSHPMRGDYGLEVAEVTIIGSPVNIEVVWYTCEQLIHRIRAQAPIRFAQYNGPEKRNTFIRGYLRGAIVGIWYKLYQQKQAMMNDNNQFSLMVTHNQLAVQAKMDQLFPDRKQGKHSQISSQHGYYLGKIDGKDMNIHKGLSNNTNVNGNKLIH